MMSPRSLPLPTRYPRASVRLGCSEEGGWETLGPRAILLTGAVGRRTREIDQDPIAHVLGDKAVEPATVSATAGSSGRLRSGSTAPASRFHGAVLDSMELTSE